MSGIGAVMGGGVGQFFFEVAGAFILGASGALGGAVIMFIWKHNIEPGLKKKPDDPN